ncbi:MAG: class I SAM-dependent methyltransferase [Firmicutes bacterium]|nr:class I SAM-dependent methyltransferase [Bacillota bacterium]
MKPDYKNWVPKGMIAGFGAGAACCLGLVAVCSKDRIPNDALRKVLRGGLLLGGISLGGAMIWLQKMHNAFSYDGERQMSKIIIDGIAEYVDLPNGGKGLDVGCGSGALAIACAKRNPNASFVGIDRWGKEYASYNKPLCDSNAKAEGTANVSFRQGNAESLDFPDESFDAVTSNYVYHNIPGDRQDLLLETLRVLKKGGTFAIHDIFSKRRYGNMQAFIEKLKSMGYEDARLIDTTDGMFMTKGEALWMDLSGSALLVGRK